jgi:hypothetical protein
MTCLTRILTRRGLLTDARITRDARQAAHSSKPNRREATTTDASDRLALLGLLALSVLLLSVSAAAARSMSWLEDWAYRYGWRGR